MTKLIKSFPPIALILWLMGRIKGRRKVIYFDELSEWGDKEMKAFDEIRAKSKPPKSNWPKPSPDDTITDLKTGRVYPKSKRVKLRVKDGGKMMLYPFQPYNDLTYIETPQTREPFKTKPPFEKPKERKLS